MGSDRVPKDRAYLNKNSAEMKLDFLFRNQSLFRARLLDRGP